MIAPMKILVIGKGGREHALCATLLRCSKEQGNRAVELFCAPGSDAIAEIATLVEISSVQSIVDWAKQQQIDLVVAGEEAWLIKDEGLANACLKAGIPCWGPQKSAAQLEASKAFAKRFMQRHNIPTADFSVVSDLDSARTTIGNTFPIVLKFDGLAAGKGVAVCENAEEAESFLAQVFQDHRFGEGELLVEQALTGPEISIFVAVSGPHYQILASARDYKRLQDNDKGPNTGGMGAVSSLDIVDAATLAQIETEIIAPTVDGLQKEQLPYHGFLYFGLMLTPTGPQVIEYNVRFGDPECQAVMPMVEGDFAQFLLDGANGKLGNQLQIHSGWSVTLCAASANYPQSSRSGDIISGLETLPSSISLFHAGTKKHNGNWQTAGGRVLAVSAQAPTKEEARNKAYAALEQISFADMQTRTDIGITNFE